MSYKGLNEKERISLTIPIYGCSTTGMEWNFLKLEESNLTIAVNLAVPVQLLGVSQLLLSLLQKVSLKKSYLF